jgi:hypothetical protein
LADPRPITFRQRMKIPSVQGKIGRTLRGLQV